jgi:hypothetical protein
VLDDIDGYCSGKYRCTDKERLHLAFPDVKPRGNADCQKRKRHFIAKLGKKYHKGRDGVVSNAVDQGSDYDVRVLYAGIFDYALADDAESEKGKHTDDDKADMPACYEEMLFAQIDQEAKEQNQDDDRGEYKFTNRGTDYVEACGEYEPDADKDEGP